MQWLTGARWPERKRPCNNPTPARRVVRTCYLSAPFGILHLFMRLLSRGAMAAFANISTHLRWHRNLDLAIHDTCLERSQRLVRKLPLGIAGSQIEGHAVFRT